MCDCYWAKCEECGTRVPVHIADFCVSRDEVQARCRDHPPPRPEEGWVRFDEFARDPDFDENPADEVGTMYLRCTATDEELQAAADRVNARLRERGYKVDLIEEPYFVGNVGGICPNTGPCRESVWRDGDWARRGSDVFGQ